MRVVLDTNIFLSALLSSRGIPNLIYHAWQDDVFKLVTSKVQLEELRRASRYPKLKQLIKPAKVGTMINHMQRAIVLQHLVIDQELNDPDDAFLLAMATAGQADYLVTGDKRAGLLELKHIKRTRIVTPLAFHSEVLNR